MSSDSVGRMKTLGVSELIYRACGQLQIVKLPWNWERLSNQPFKRKSKT